MLPNLRFCLVLALSIAVVNVAYASCPDRAQLITSLSHLPQACLKEDGVRNAVHFLVGALSESMPSDFMKRLHSSGPALEAVAVEQDSIALNGSSSDNLSLMAKSCSDDHLSGLTQPLCASNFAPFEDMVSQLASALQNGPRDSLHVAKKLQQSLDELASTSVVARLARSANSQADEDLSSTNVELSRKYNTLYQDVGAWESRVGCNGLSALPELTDGCSIPAQYRGGAVDWYAWLFADGCQIHDICYGCGSVIGETQRSCDDTFYENLKGLCNDNFCRKTWQYLERTACHGFAKIFYEAVKYGGSASFKKSSDGRCSSNSCFQRMVQYRFSQEIKC